MEVSLMRQLIAIAASVANSIARRFSTGSAPGMPRQTGHTFVFGGAPNLLEHPQKIFVSVNSWTWTSSPMTAWYFARTSGVIDVALGIPSSFEVLPHFWQAAVFSVRLAPARD